MADVVSSRPPCFLSLREPPLLQERLCNSLCSPAQVPPPPPSRSSSLVQPARSLQIRPADILGCGFPAIFRVQVISHCYLRFLMAVFRQVPNFLLALPILSLAILCASSFLSDHRNLLHPRSLYEVLSGGAGGSTGKRRRALGGISSGLNLDTLPYVAHAAFLAIFAFFFINVQVVALQSS